MEEDKQNLSLNPENPSKDVYFKTVKIFAEACEKLKAEESVDCNDLYKALQEVIQIISKDEKILLGLANAPYSYVNRHLHERVNSGIIIHAINVMIYSLKMSIALGVPDNRLPYVAMASIFHTVGMLDADKELNTQLVNCPVDAIEERKFEKNVKKYIGKIRIDDFHSDSLLFLISLVEEDKDVLTRTNLQEAMYQYAMIIHVCNEFERLTHINSFKEVFAPVDAMKLMRDEMRDYFHPDIIKLFFNKLSIYPLGSFVKLSSQETAKIVEINENFIMRPVIIIVLDPEGREKESPIKINLREKPNIYIKKAVVDEYLTEKFIDLF